LNILDVSIAPNGIPVAPPARFAVVKLIPSANAPVVVVAGNAPLPIEPKLVLIPVVGTELNKLLIPIPGAIAVPAASVVRATPGLTPLENILAILPPNKLSCPPNKPPVAPPNKAPLIGLLPVIAAPTAPTPAPIVTGLIFVCKKF